ncbi:MAG: HAMP domain-containing sensor histidine kinase [Tissierellia bacterium]|nr:HAMP domain-containing sensor histidine kinase [Tissierellia bacterium]
MINRNSYGLVDQFIYKTLKYILVSFPVLLIVHFIGYYLINRYLPVTEVGFKNHFYKDIILFVSLIICFVIYIVYMIDLVKKQRDYITYLIDEVHVINNGDYRNPILLQGNNELSHLASHVELLRNQMLKNHEIQKKTNERQTRVLSSISHDLRTPLTTLTGYLEILNDEDFDDEDLKKQYMKYTLDRAYQLQDLTDIAFEYFYIKDNENQGIKLLRCNSYMNLIDILKHCSRYIEQNGFKLDMDLPIHKVALFYDVRMVERLFDNIFTNINRYGDPDEIVRIYSKINKGQIIIKMENAIRTMRKSGESTGIGLKNCRAIMKNHKGSFYYYIEDYIYVN